MRFNLGLSALLLGLLAAMGVAASVAGHVTVNSLQREVLQLRGEAEDARRLMSALYEGDSKFRAYLLYRQPAYLEGLYRAMATVEDARVQAVARAVEAEGEGEVRLGLLLSGWAAQRREGHRFLAAGEEELVLAAGRSGAGQEATDVAVAQLNRFLASRAERLDALTNRLERVGEVTTGFVVGSAVVSGLGLVPVVLLLRRRQREEAAARWSASGRKSPPCCG